MDDLVTQDLDPSEAVPSRMADFAAREAHFLELSGAYLGVSKRLKRDVSSRLDVHVAILAGLLTNAALGFLLTTLTRLGEHDVANVLGISVRTLRRQKETPKKPLPPDLASKAWLFAETLARATEVFGSREKAEEWMNKPAMGLDGQRPVEMLQTVQGAELVGEFLTRLEYGIYS